MKTIMTTKELFEEVREAIEKFAINTLRGDHSQHWHALRIRPDGEIYTSCEPSPCYSESEYFHRVPHTLTIHTHRGDGWNPTKDENPGWFENDDGSLDLDYFVGDTPDADDVCYQWKDRLQEWIDAGNFTGCIVETV